MQVGSNDFEANETRARHRRQWIGFGALILLVVLLLGLVMSTMQQARMRKAAELQHVRTQQVLIATGRLQSTIHAAGRSVRGFMITNDARSLQLFEQAHADSDALVRQLGALTANDPPHFAEARRIGRELDEIYRMGDRLIALQRAGDMTAATAPLRSGDTEAMLGRLLTDIDRLAADEVAEQRRHAAAAQTADRRQELLTYLLAAAAMGFLIVAALIGAGASRAHRRSVALSARLHHMATHDELTGLYNRREFLERLQRERDRAARTGAPLAVAILDVDHFKRINDGHGHQAGDTVLAHVAGVLARGVRSIDLVGRIGGEEFAIILPDTDFEGARAICERLRRTIARSSVTLPSGAEALLTISTGIALLARGEDRDGVMGRADHALYAAKTGGRNQVRIAA